MTSIIKKRTAAVFSIAILAAVYLGYTLYAADTDKVHFLPSKTSNGHHQLQEKCTLCHVPFKGIKEQACIECHKQELKAVRDTHAAKIFRDPRNAEDLQKIDVLSCLTCHKEHLADSYPNGVTVPADFCIHCHQDISKKRPSHQGMDFSRCWECHNYHDNTALYEDFLAKHLDEPNTLDDPTLAQRNFLHFYKKNFGKTTEPLSRNDMDAPEAGKFTAAQDWLGSSHAQAGVNCTACHTKEGGSWQDHLDQSYCAGCHENETQGFLQGKHGLRRTQNLLPMTTDKARHAMQPESKTVTCFSCHPAHQFDTRKAAVEACLNCHADQHSLAYKNSLHFRSWEYEQYGHTKPGTGVSCATCHLPRIAKHHLRDKQKKKRKKKRKRKKKIRPVKVEHNQNTNLWPNGKMIKTVCQNCHGLQFILDALADDNLIQNNFSGLPGKHLKSMDMVKQRQE